MPVGRGPSKWVEKFVITARIFPMVAAVLLVSLFVLPVLRLLCAPRVVLFPVLLACSSPLIVAGQVHELAISSGDRDDYGRLVCRILDLEEKELGRPLRPGEKRRVGIKVYTASGRGLETPRMLTVGAIDALRARGFRSDEIFVIDESSFDLWECGYLAHPFPSAEGKTFHGVPVVSLKNDRCYDENWFYDCPLGRREPDIFHPFWAHESPKESDTSWRRSYLPVILFFDVDFWINLPRLRADRTLTVSGSVANGTIFNMTNSRRFFGNPKHAALAMVEVLSIPEFKRVPVIHILDLTRFQVIEQNVYRSYFCGSSNRLIFGHDPVEVDYYGWKVMNRERRKYGLPDLPLPEWLGYGTDDGAYGFGGD